MLSLYENNSGQAPGPNDAAAYSNEVQLSSMPVLADADGSYRNNTPITNNTRPELCVIAPDMSILSCYAGHNKIQQAFNGIRNHAGL